MSLGAWFKLRQSPALRGLPRVAVRRTESLADVIIRIQDFAEDDLLDEMGIDDPLELTGLYSGRDLTQKSIMDPTPQAPMVFLYRHAILYEWITHGDVTLSDLVAHVLVHEVGHHFGLSDEQMDALLEEAD